MSDDGLDDVQGNARVCREGYKRVPQGMEGCLWGKLVASFDANGHRDVSAFEDAGQFVTHLPAAAGVKFADGRKDGARQKC